VIEDYVHSGVKFAALVAVRLGCFALAATGIVAALRIAFSGYWDGARLTVRNKGREANDGCVSSEQLRGRIYRLKN
jgi:hypothetical protein